MEQQPAWVPPGQPNDCHFDIEVPSIEPFTEGIDRCVQLIAIGTGFLRTFGIIFSGIVTVTCYWLFIPSHGIQAAPWVSTLGMAVLALIYGYAVLGIYRKRKARVTGSLEQGAAGAPPAAPQNGRQT